MRSTPGKANVLPGAMHLIKRGTLLLKHIGSQKLKGVVKSGVKQLVKIQSNYKYLRHICLCLYSLQTANILYMNVMKCDEIKLL